MVTNMAVKKYFVASSRFEGTTTAQFVQQVSNNLANFGVKVMPD